MRRIRLHLLLAMGASVATSAAFAQEQAEKPPAVVVQTVKSEIVQSNESYVGRVVALSSVDVIARVDGFLEGQAFVEGATVKRGDVLYTIEQGSYKAAVDKAKANVAGAEATAKNAEIEATRQQDLLQKGDVSQAAYDSAAATAAAAQAAHDEAAADLAAAQINMDYTRVVSPIDGRIGQSAIDVGNLVGPDSGVLTTIVSVDPVEVEFQVPAPVLLGLRQKNLIGGDSPVMEARITLSDGSAFANPGKIDFVDVQVQQATDSVALKASYANPDSLLMPGQFVVVRLVDPTAKPVIVVPQTALQLDAKGHFVYVVDGDSKVERRDVTLGAQLSGGTWVVENGLTGGDRVITQGLQKVRESEAVTPTEASG